MQHINQPVRRLFALNYLEIIRLSASEFAQPLTTISVVFMPLHSPWTI